MPDSKTILVVDDDDTLRLSIQAMLRKKGFATLEADDGLEARRMIDRHRPDLVILDMMMPNWGGLAVLEHFKEQEDAPPFIMVSANDGPKHKAYAEKMGATTYLHKPFSMDRLIEQVNQRLCPADAKPTPKSRCRCVHCGVKIRIPREMLGQTRECPGCKQETVLQPESPKDEGVKLMP